jgi:UDP-GlcNAc:undecaprenyl-phosphate GlcNAc-1-phosphate transferase
MSRLLPILVAAGAGVPFVISVAGTAIVRAWARRRGFVDKPGGHKAHAAPVALGGGIAIFVAILLPLIAVLLLAHVGSTRLPPEALNHTFRLGGHNARVADLLGGIALKMPPALAVVAGAIILHIMGLIDDVRPLGPGIKMLVMTVVALVLTAGFGIRSLDMLGPVPATVITTFWIVLITNAFNFMDNMDGLSAGVAAITAIFFAAAATIAGQVFVPALALVLVGAILGFLVYNFPPATIFMGDAGSLVIGYLMAVLTVLTNYYNPEQQRMPFGVLAPLVVLAVPLYDVTSVVIVRIREGVSPFRGDRRHFSHRLVRRGLQTRSAVLTIYLATAATGCSSLLLPMVSWPFAVLIGVQCFCIVLIVAILESTGGPAKPEES